MTERPDQAQAPETNISAARARALEVADTLRDRIIRGTLAPGDRIVERKLSQELDVSRTPVREALKLLESDGLIEISRNRGAQVSTFSGTAARQLFDVIAGLEGLAAYRFAQRITEAELGELEALHAKILYFYGRSQIEPYFEANTAIHDYVVEGCGNPVIVETHGRLMLKARRGRFMAIMSPDRWAQSVREHEGLMTALRDRDPDLAQSVWTTHLRNTGETLAEVIENRD